jgi:hypothetical protein
MANLEFSVEGWEYLNGAFSFYSFFDLLLLFSVFQGILLIISIPFHTNDTPAYKWLLLAIGLSSLSIILYLLSNFQGAVQSIPKVFFLSGFVIFLYAPIYYFTKENYFSMPSSSHLVGIYILFHFLFNYSFIYPFYCR